MHDTWKDMFVLGLPLMEKILRPVFACGGQMTARLSM
jgi:hypothetical protein